MPGSHPGAPLSDAPASVGVLMATNRQPPPVVIVDFLRSVEAVLLDGALLVARAADAPETARRVEAALLALR